MRFSSLQLLALAALPLLSQCGSPQPATTATTTSPAASVTTAAPATGNTNSAVSVADLNRQFIAAWNAHDLEKTLSYLADDVQLLQGSAHFSGKAEVSDKWVRATQSTLNNLKLSTVSAATTPQLAYEAGTFAVEVQPAGPGQPAGYGQGNFLLLWKPAADGKWQLSYAQLEGLPVRRR